VNIGNLTGDTVRPSIPEYPLILIFTTVGASFLVSSTDLVSLYLAIELQSFAVYILATIYRNSEAATSAGLKYFLLGALSSALILLGSRVIYSYTGLTQLDAISRLMSVDSGVRLGNTSMGVYLGLLIMTIGFLFKVGAAPFHN
jgi:NADH-ubiquinone oxidoreductase chain 2